MLYFGYDLSYRLIFLFIYGFVNNNNNKTVSVQMLTMFNHRYPINVWIKWEGH